MNRSWLSNLFPVRRRTPITRKPSQRAGLKVQTLEDRTVPSTFKVTNLFDVGIVGSLRWAISQANTNEGDDTIAFDGSFDTETPQIITLNGTQLKINDATGTTTIQGPSVGVTIDAQGASRVFAVVAGASAVFDGLTISGGNLPAAGKGGGVHNAGRLTISNSTIIENNANEGGGVYNKGTITLSNSTIMDNLATGGGGVSNDGTMSIDRSTIMGNRAISNSINISPLGGGLLGNGGAITITNSTINNNLAESTAESAAFGGGVMNNNGSLTIINSTISGNVARGSYGMAGGIYFNQFNGDDPLSMINNTISENVATVNRDMALYSNNNITIKNTIVAGDYSVENYSITGEYTGSNNILGGDAKLGPLQDNGGPTHTMALLEGSPAIDAGVFVDGVTTDQRGYGRNPDTIDIGAYEAEAKQPPAIIAPSSMFAYDNESTILNGLDIQQGFSDHLALVLSTPNSTIKLRNGSGLTDSDPATNKVQLVGTIAQLNAALDNIVFVGNASVTRSETLSIWANDRNDNNVVSTVPISIYSLPTLSVPGSQTVYEDEDLLIDGISIEGGAPGDFTVTLNATQGTLIVDDTNVVVTNNNTGSVTVTGTSANINAALATLVYNGNSAGSDELSITATDSGGKQASSSIAINVLSVADQLEILRNEVRALKDDGTLNKGKATALLASLNLKGNKGDFGKLQSFINKVNDFLLEGILSQVQADSLRTKAENLLLGMTRQ
ncbi:MAG: right-handed parallel beta-helix repeat-containing protein [Gemmataceae bacterium]